MYAIIVAFISLNGTL